MTICAIEKKCNQEVIYAYEKRKYKKALYSHIKSDNVSMYADKSCYCVCGRGL